MDALRCVKPLVLRVLRVGSRQPKARAPPGPLAFAPPPCNRASQAHKSHVVHVTSHGVMPPLRNGLYLPLDLHRVDAAAAAAFLG